MFRSKTKKLSIVAGAIASAITLSTFGSFAIGLTSEYLAGQTIGTSTETSSSSEQQTDNSTNLPKDPVNEKTIEAPTPKLIKLDTPGDYRLVGAGKGISNNQDPNEIIVNTKDVIHIGDTKDHRGDINKPRKKYNIILDNVNIDINDPKPFYDNAINIGGNTDVNLILVGKNFLGSHIKSCGGLTTSLNARLTITGSNEDSSLDVFGQHYGMTCHGNMTINGGMITVNTDKEEEAGIDCSGDLIINRGTIAVTGGRYGIKARNIEINDSTINSTARAQGISCESDLTITNSKINVASGYADICCKKIATINNSTINATGKSSNIDCKANLTINNSTIITTGEYGIYMLSGDLKINGGNVNANKIFVQDNIIMNGGELTTDSINHVNFGHDMSKLFNKSTKLYATYDPSTEMYGIYDDKGKRVWIKNVGQNNNDEILVYCLTLSYSNAKFYITGGTINGIMDFTPGASSNIPTGCLPFGSQFPGQGPTGEPCDIEMFFNNK